MSTASLTHICAPCCCELPQLQLQQLDCHDMCTRGTMPSGMQVAVITELCEGGSLFHTLRNRGVSAWPWCACAAVVYCLW